jgi:hypothetical protein
MAGHPLDQVVDLDLRSVQFDDEQGLGVEGIAAWTKSSAA